MAENEAELLQQIARRNWIVLALLTAASLLLRSSGLTLGVIAGGLVAITAYHWLYRSVSKVLALPQQGAARKFKFSYFVRLGSLAIVLYALIALAKVNPIGLAIGLSVVVLNLMWTTLRRAF